MCSGYYSKQGTLSVFKVEKGQVSGGQITLFCSQLTATIFKEQVERVLGLISNACQRARHGNGSPFHECSTNAVQINKQMHERHLSDEL